MDGFPDRLGTAAHNDGEAGEAGSGERSAGDRGYGLAFRVSEVDGFAIGALCCEACDAGFGKADGMSGDCCCIEVFGDGVEETDSWDVDSWNQWTVDVVFGVEGCAGVGGAVLRIVQCGLRVDAVGIAT